MSMNINVKIILGCTIALIVFLSGSMYFMFKHLDELTTSPFIYGANKVAGSNNVQDVFCTCLLKDSIPGASYPLFFFNTTNIWDETDMERYDLKHMDLQIPTVN